MLDGRGEGLEAGGWRLEAGGWRLEAGGRNSDLRLRTERKSAVSIFIIDSISAKSASPESPAAHPMSRARSRWLSSSYAEPKAIPRYRANMGCEPDPAPSAMLAEMETALLRI